LLKSKKQFQVIGISYAALISVIFGLMITSFPIGAYVVFNSEIGDEINYEYPIERLNFFLGGINFELPWILELGDTFIVIWSIFIILFGIAIFGPRKNFLNVLGSLMIEGINHSKNNYLIITIKWLSILIVISATINFIQEGIGIQIQPPVSDNQLILFYDVTLAPLIEETGFRVLLIGLPLFAIYSFKSSFYSFFKALWMPKENLDISSEKNALALIIGVGLLFGIAHIISGEPWSIGKFVQAAASGIILGWVYFRYGLLPAILIHWGINYFIFSYVYFIADINAISIHSAFSHSLISTLEMLLIITGILSIIILLSEYFYSRKEKKLEI